MVDRHDVQAFEMVDGTWGFICVTCPSNTQGITADEAYRRVAACAPDPEPWITPPGRRGYRARRFP